MNAFDALAPTYDADFARSPIAQHLRARVHERLLHHLRQGMHALELGCGTGEDALELARHGLRLTITDASAGMLAIARDKLSGYDVTCQPLDLNAPPSADLTGPYDGVYANFGVLNCVTGLAELAQWLTLRIRPGGFAGFSIMAPFCLWETAWHGLHGNWRVASRRWRTAQFGDESTPMPIHYPTVRRVTRLFAPSFRRLAVYPLGFILPPTDVYGALERRPAWCQRLMRWDAHLFPVAQLANLADHYWIEFVRI